MLWKKRKKAKKRKKKRKIVEFLHLTLNKNEDDERQREGESQGRAAGPWVPVDKAIMDYHNWRTLEWVIRGKAYKTGTEDPARGRFFLVSQICKDANKKWHCGLWHEVALPAQQRGTNARLCANCRIPNHLEYGSNAIDYDTPR